VHVTDIRRTDGNRYLIATDDNSFRANNRQQLLFNLNAARKVVVCWQPDSLVIARQCMRYTIVYSSKPSKPSKAIAVYDVTQSAFACRVERISLLKFIDYLCVVFCDFLSPFHGFISLFVTLSVMIGGNRVSWPRLGHRI